MQKSHEVARRFREVFLNGTWIANTNYKDQLTGLNWELANKQIASLNTIALLARHIHYYVAGVKAVLRGGSLDIRDKHSFDFPPLPSQAEWDAFLARFFADAEEFAALVEALPQEGLEQVFVEEKYGTYQRNIDAMIEHSYYHLGQLVLIKKLITTDSSNAGSVHQ